MSKGIFFNDNDWPLEQRKKVIRTLPNNVYDCIQKVVAVSAYPSINEPPNFQQGIEQCLFQLPTERGAKLNPLLHFKILNVIASAYIFDCKSDEARKSFFNRLFLGREANAMIDPAAHDNRISALIRFSSLALQYPMPYFFDTLAEWLIKDDHGFRYATSIFSEICKGYLLRPVSWEMHAFVEPLEESAFEFSALGGIYFVTKENFAEPHRASLVSVLGKWYSGRPLDYLAFYSKYANLAKDFALRRFPVLLEYTCTNDIGDVIHERFHAGVIGLIMASEKMFSETPLDLTYLRNVKESDTKINQDRVNEILLASKMLKLIAL